MTEWVIAVAGGIASGKSTFIAALADAIGAQTTAFGALVREDAVKRGLDPTSREVLQDIGEKLKAELGAVEFSRRVLCRAPTTASVIVDGIRHVDIVDALAEAAPPRRFAFVFLHADLTTRQTRASERSRDGAQLRELDQHSTERQVHDGTLVERADLVLDARSHISDLVEATVAKLAST